MDSPKKNTDLEVGGKPKYTSIYFPPEPIVTNQPVDAAMIDYLTRVAEKKIQYQAYNGVSFLRMWLDAQKAEEVESGITSYHQYLIIARKITGRMLAREIEPEKTGTKPLISLKTPSATEEASHNKDAPTLVPALAPIPARTTPSSDLVTPSQARLNPAATAFSPTAPVTKEPQHSAGTKPSTIGVAGFEDRCKQLGLRISSAKKE